MEDVADKNRLPGDPSQGNELWRDDCALGQLRRIVELLSEIPSEQGCAVVTRYLHHPGQEPPRRR